MDQIFDRLEKLFKSLLSGDSDDEPRASSRRSADPDLADAMDELDDFLTKDRDTLEREAREREARERLERERRKASSASAASGHPKRVADAYATLGLRYGSSLAEVKAAYKKLLKLHHPDRHALDPVQHKKATELSSRINSAYSLLEVWLATGKIPPD